MTAYEMRISDVSSDVCSSYLLLDSIAGNALGLRLDDKEFAREVYGELVENVVRAPERWYDADVRIRLSAVDAGNTVDVPRFAVTVIWEYSVEIGRAHV